MSEKTKKELEAEEKVNQAVDEAVGLFFDADRSLANTQLSRGSVIRAIRFAMHNGLTNKQIKLKSDQEARLALFFGTMLDSRLLMQAKLKQTFDNKTKEEKSNESKKES
jgi:hypothetical protein